MKNNLHKKCYDPDQCFGRNCDTCPDSIPGRMIGSIKPCFKYPMFTKKYYLSQMEIDHKRNEAIFVERHRPKKVIMSKL